LFDKCAEAEILNSELFYNMPLWEVLDGSIKHGDIPKSIWDISDKTHRDLNFGEREVFNINNYNTRTRKKTEKYFSKLANEATIRTLNIFCLKLIEFENKYFYPIPSKESAYYLSIYFPKLERGLLDCLFNFFFKLNRKDLYMELGERIWERFFKSLVTHINNLSDTDFDASNDWYITQHYGYIVDRLSINSASYSNDDTISYPDSYPKASNLLALHWECTQLQKKAEKTLIEYGVKIS